MSDHPQTTPWNDDDLPVLTELAADEQQALAEYTPETPPVVEMTLVEPVYQDISLSPVLETPEPTPPVETAVTSSSAFPFELLLVSDEQEQAENKISASELPPHIHNDALSMIENRLAAMRAGVRTVPPPSLSPSDTPSKPTKQVAVLGETALTEALYQAVLPRVKAEVMTWMQEMLAIQTQQLCEGVLRQFKTDYEVMFGDALRDSLRQAVHEVRRQPLKKG